MTRLLLAAAIALAGTASSAQALTDCQPGDVNCYRTCYLPHIDKNGIYPVNC